ncbi:MAG TPA: serpin family protein [Bacteroidales bacterium]|nr:serpin family protein [Bacteroidales bacterium]HRZ47844.1 serpin family protein [Bacteroidales bacterium]
MKRAKVFALLAIIAMLIPFVSCTKDHLADTTPAHFDLSPQGRALVTASNDFAFRMFKETDAGTAPGKNMMVSPLSISYALGMALNGAGTITYDSIRNTLGFNLLTLQDINSSYKALIPFLLNADPSTTLKIANSVWYTTGFNPKQTFLDTVGYYFNAYLSQIDFSSPGAKNTINDWVANNTGGKIKNMLSSINPQDVMYLINAVYFKGNWTIKFDKSKTADKPFQKASGTVNVPTMHNKQNFRYFYHSDFAMLELDYGQTNYAMDLMLPHSGKTPADIVQQLDAASFDQWAQQLDTVHDMDIAIPKFKFEFETSLKDALSSMGMGIAFSDFADFSDISSDYQLLITDVKHKTFIDVNEEGTEAAAATSIGIGVTSMPPSFIADRPFLFVIREKDTNTILFIGKVCDPAY